MKRLLVFGLVAGLAFTGCLKSGGGTWGKVEPGYNIFLAAHNQNAASMVQANMGARLAMIVSEADKQGIDNPSEVTVGGVNIKNMLLGASTTIEKAATGYKITFPAPGLFDSDGWSYEGTVLVNTSGHELLSETSVESPWTVSYSGNFKFKANMANGQTEYTAIGGTTEIRFNNNGTYEFKLISQRLYIADYRDYPSDWSGLFILHPSDISMAYSDNKDKKFGFDGIASGNSCYSLTKKLTNANLVYKLDEGEYSSMYIDKGKVECTLIGDYSVEAFPSRTVLVEWIPDGSNMKIRITYNGYVHQ